MDLGLHQHEDRSNVTLEMRPNTSVMAGAYSIRLLLQTKLQVNQEMGLPNFVRGAKLFCG